MRASQDALSRRLEALIEKLPEQKRSPLRELLNSLLDRAHSLEAEHDSLARLEEKYLLALKEDSSNIINFRQPSEKIETPARQERRWDLKVPCLIEAASQGEIFRMAFELHLRSTKNMFLPWRDIDPAARQNSRTLLELSSSTLFISDVTDLPAVEQATILAALRDPNVEKPHFVGGTHSPYADLLSFRGLERDFLDAMSQAYLKLTKPVTQYKREGLIRYFLESLS
jgi:hypothetical protein